MNNEVGKTKDAGFQFGVRKTFNLPSEQAWNFLFSDAGLKIWLGNLTSGLQQKKEFTTVEGVTGYIRVLKMFSHVRLSWKKSDWPNESILQIRVIPAGEKTTISFHHEKLLDQEQRSEVKEYWNSVIKQMTKILKT